MNRFTKNVGTLYGKHLFVSNTITCSLLMATGDLVVQKITKKTHDDLHDWKRTIKMAFAGITMGPLEHVFYQKLDQIYPMQNRRNVPKKLSLDLTLGASMFITTFFLSYNIWEKNLEESVAELKQKFWHVYKVDVVIWLPAQIINFTFIPPKFRVLYVSVITVIYTTALSYIKHQ